jgi:sodium transport system ATP-binding protein
MIEVEHLRKQFGSRVVIKDICFQASNAAITGILGANGAGKTTLLRMISGMLTPNLGDAKIDGTSVGKLFPAAQLRLGSLLDHTGIYSKLTPRENLTLYGRLRQIPPPLLNRRVDETLQLLGLTELANESCAGFSLGERTKVALGRVLVHRPRNLVLDKLTNALDILSIRSLRNLLRAIREEGRCILFSSHVLDEVQDLYDRVVILSAGQVIAQGTIPEICRQTNTPNLEEAFVYVTTLAGEV